MCEPKRSRAYLAPAANHHASVSLCHVIAPKATNRQLRAGGVLSNLHSRLSFCPCLSAPLVHGDAQLPQLPLGDLDLAHELVVGLGDVVEGQDAPAEADEQVGAEGDEGPEGQDGHDLGLDDGGEGDQVEVEGEVGLFYYRISLALCATCGLVVVAVTVGMDVPSSRGGRWRWSAGRASSCSLLSGGLWKIFLVDRTGGLG